MRARQIECQNQDIEEAVTHLQRMWLQKKKQYDQLKNLIKEILKVKDLILLHDTKLESSHSKKLNFQWLELYHVWKIIPNLGFYFLEELDETSITSSIHDDQLKKFWLQDSRFNISDNNKNSDDDSTEQFTDNREKIDFEKKDEDWIFSEKKFAVLI